MFLVAGCTTATPPLKMGDKTWGDYSFTNKINVKVDEEVALDGYLNEDFWGNSTALEYVSKGEALANKGANYVGFQDATLSMKTYFSEVGLYIGIEVDDPVIYNTGKLGSMWQETNMEIYVSYGDNTTLENASQIWMGPSNNVLFGKRLDDGYYSCTAKNFGVVSRITETGYVSEAVISWQDLGGDEIPAYVRMYPCMIRVKEAPYKDGNQIHIWQNFADELGAGYGDVKSWLKFKTTGYQDSKKAEPFSTYDASAFANYPEEKINEYNGNRSLAFKSYYVKNEGLWVNGVAEHNTHVATGSFGNCTNFEFQIEGKQAYIFISDGKLKGAGFDEEQSMMWTVENPAGAPTNYTSYVIAFIPNSLLLDLGVSQTVLDRGYFQLLGAFKTAGENAIFNESASVAAPDWWRTDVVLVGESGFFTTTGRTVSVNFTTETKKYFGYSAMLNEYGLYIEADAKTDASINTLVGIEYTAKLWSASDAGSNRLYIGRNGGNEPSWRNITAVTCGNRAETGYATRIKYRIFMDYDYLKNLGFTYNFNTLNPKESTVYINLCLDVKTEENLTFEYTDTTGVLQTRTSTDAYGWCIYSWWVGGFDASNINYGRVAVTKNGIA